MNIYKNWIFAKKKKKKNSLTNAKKNVVAGSVEEHVLRDVKRHIPIGHTVSEK